MLPVSSRLGGEPFGHPITGHDLPYKRNPLGFLWCDRFDDVGKALEPNYNYTEYSVFPGSLTLLLAIVGAFCRGAALRWFAVLALAGTFLMALGAAPLRWLYSLPGIETIPPLRCVGVASLLIAWLAAIGN